MSGFIDLHSHLLPHLDDGSETLEQSVAVLESFGASGVLAVALTPHTSNEDLDQHGDDVVEQRGEVLTTLQEDAPAAPELFLGFEIMVRRDVAALVFRDRRFSINGSRYFLVEFPVRISPEAAGTALEQIGATRAVPLVAHPERYINCGPEHVARWREAGARMQLDATALTRRGPRGQRARALLSAGLADIVAADNHGDRRIITTAVRYLERNGHAEAARILAVENPRAVLEDREMIAVPPVRISEGLVSRIRRRLRRSEQ